MRMNNGHAVSLLPPLPLQLPLQSPLPLASVSASVSDSTRTRTSTDSISCCRKDVTPSHARRAVDQRVEVVVVERLSHRQRVKV
jgi:hypothetical protein